MNLPYTFRDPSLLVRALTRRSYVNERPEAGPDNEALEFLGDAVIELLVTEHLFRSRLFDEGVLSRCRSAVVNRTALAALAREFSLGEHLRLGGGDRRQNMQHSDSVLSDTLEAVVGAVFQDGGYAAAEAAFGPALRARVDVLPERPIDDRSALQEWLQKRRLFPEYVAGAVRGPDNARIFEVELRVGGRTVSLGEGPSLKRAEQDAAMNAMALTAGGRTVLEVAVEADVPPPTQAGGPEKNPKNQLLELCQQNRWPLPTFHTESLPDAAGHGPGEGGRFRSTVVVNGEERGSGIAVRKKDAEKLASAEALRSLGVEATA